MAGIMSSFLALYGIGGRPELKVAGTTSTKLCEDPSTRKGNHTREECIEDLVKTERDFGIGADRFLMDHIELLQATRTDVYSSRVQLILKILRSLPIWLLFILVALIIIGIIIGFIPLLVIMGNLGIKGWTKVGMLIGLMCLTVFAYVFIPM